MTWDIGNINPTAELRYYDKRHGDENNAHGGIMHREMLDADGTEKKRRPLTLIQFQITGT